MAELRKYAACFHLLAAPPQALVVDDMSDFLDSRRAHQQYSVTAARALTRIKRGAFTSSAASLRGGSCSDSCSVGQPLCAGSWTGARRRRTW